MHNGTYLPFPTPPTAIHTFAWLKLLRFLLIYLFLQPSLKKRKEKKSYGFKISTWAVE